MRNPAPEIPVSLDENQRLMLNYGSFIVLELSFRSKNGVIYFYSKQSEANIVKYLD